MLLAQIPALDFAIVILYVLGTMLVGAWFTTSNRNTIDYFIGGRNVSAWLILFSVVATETSTVTFLSAPGKAYNPGGNLQFMQLVFGFILGRCLVAWLLVPSYMNGEILTAYEVLRKRFDVRVQRTASGIFLLSRTLGDGLRLFLTAFLLKLFIGWDLNVCILAMGIATILYTYLGGMKAVIWTDLIQFVVYSLGAVIAAGFILNHIEGGWASFVSTGMAAGKFQTFDFHWDITKPLLFWSGLIGGSFLSMATHGADQLTVQRLLCARSVFAARAAVVASGFVVMIQFLLFLLIGIGLYVISVQDDSFFPTTVAADGDQVFGYFIVHALPTGLVGLLIAAVLSAAMSTLSSSLNCSANAIVYDFYQPLRSGRGDDHYLKVSKGMTALCGVAQIIVAVIAGVMLQKSVIDAVLTVAAVATGIILGLFLLGRMRHAVRSTAVLVGIVGAFIVVLVVIGGTSIAFPWYAPIGTILTLVFSWFTDFMMGRAVTRNRTA